MSLHWHVIITQSRQFILRLHLGVVRSKNFVKCILQQIVGSHKVFVLPIYLSSTSVIIKKNLIVSKKNKKEVGFGISTPASPSLVVVVQSRSHIQLFATSWTAAGQTSLSFTISRSFLKPMSIELVMPSNHPVLCHPLLPLPSIFPSISVFSNELALCSGGLSIGASASASVLPMNI